MNSVVRFITLIICVIGTGACKIGPEPISYGSDVCQFCSMTIIDKQHGSELVTGKGKVFKFDSVECLLNYRNELDGEAGAMYLCNHYTAPGELIFVEEASFLISEGIPSPMGAYLTAFESEEAAFKAKNEYGGDLFNWAELLEHWENHYVYYE